MEAMGVTWSAFFANRVWPVAGSKTSAPEEWMLGSPSLVKSAVDTFAARFGALSAAMATKGTMPNTRAAMSRFTGVRQTKMQPKPYQTIVLYANISALHPK